MSTFKFTKLTQLCSFFPGGGEHFNSIFPKGIGLERPTERSNHQGIYRRRPS